MTTLALLAFIGCGSNDQLAPARDTGGNSNPGGMTSGGSDDETGGVTEAGESPVPGGDHSGASGGDTTETGGEGPLGGTASGGVGGQSETGGVVAEAGGDSGAGGEAQPVAESNWIAPEDWEVSQNPTGCEVDGVVCAPSSWTVVDDYCTSAGARLPSLMEANAILDRTFVVYVDHNYDWECALPGQTVVQNCLIAISMGDIETSDIGVYCVFD